MKGKKYDTRLMVKCATMYYKENMNQEEISDTLRVSKSSVSRILAEARKENIVKITVENPLEKNYIELEEKLEKKFNLKETIIVDSSANLDETKNNLGKATAEYLQRIIKDNQTIGVSWGTTLGEVPQHIKSNRMYDVTFIPMLGSIGEVEIDIHPNQIALKLSNKFHAECKLLYAPYIVDDYSRKKAFIQDKNIKSFFKLFDEIDIALLGIGSFIPKSSTLLKSGYYSEEDIKKLRENGAIGDISSLFLDKDGKGDKFECNERVIGIDLEGIKKIPLAIGVAGSIEKKDAILSTIRGEYINVLITDEDTAKALLE